MITRMSTLFLRTLREDPADAEVPSHRLLVRAGYIRRAAPGHLHLAAAGLRGAAQGRARSSARRWTRSAPRRCTSRRCCRASPTRPPAAGPSTATNIFRLKDRKGADYLLGPTHEEMFTLLVKDLYSSYKDLPLTLYQIQTKYRDEARPRAGHPARPRVRDEGLLLLRHRRRRAATRPTTRTATPTSGSSTGSASTTSSSRRCPARWAARRARSSCADAESARTPTSAARPCGYAANVEAVQVAGARRRSPYDDAPAAHVEDTPDTPTIDTLVDHGSTSGSRATDRPWTAADTLKNVVVMVAHPDGTREPLAIGVPGDREVDLKRLEAQLEPAEVEPFTEDDFAAQPGAGQGLHRPGRARARRTPSGIRYLRRPAGRRRAPAGSPAPTSPAGTCSTWSPAATSPPTASIEAAEVRDGDPCPDGGGPLEIGPRHRDGPHLPARPQVRRGART